MTLEQLLIDHLTRTDDIHKLLTTRINEIDRRLIEGDFRSSKTDGKIQFYEWDLYEAGITFTDYRWNGDSGAAFRISRDVFFDEEAHQRAIAKLDKAQADSKAQAALDEAKRAAGQLEAERELYETLKKKFEPKG